MDSTQGTRWEAVLAALLAMIATSGMFWTLARLMRPGPVAVVAAPRGIEAVWIVREPAPAHVVRGDPVVRTRPSSPMQPRRAHEAAPMNEPETAAAATPAASRAMSAVYLMQARTALGTQAAAPTHPLADRATRLPGDGHERFRMRTQTSVAGVVSGIGRMFGGRDPDEPCRENRRNIGDLALDGDSAALQQQLDYERRLCRP